ncbi:MAG: polyprenyl synthetase family protein [Bacteroidetes bacterium]|nr:polyprenyl synthetase family protein [Bacteroidota bacterium]
MQKFENYLDKFNKFLNNQNFNFEPNELYQPITYTLALGGKRIRPVMALLACDIFGGEYAKVIYPAMGIEIFHNFTLLHDDIMDDAPMRRGKETVCRKWDSNIAILSGDTLYAMAYKYIAQTDSVYLPHILDVFNKTAIEVCEGQQFDMNYETQKNVSIQDYLNMIRLKTAVFLGASLKIGAIIGGASQANIDNIYCFGEYIGMAFQLQDDLLDVFGDESKFGKQTGGDIITNKKTYLYIKSFELATGKTLEQLKKNFIPNHPNNGKKVKKIKAIYVELKIEQLVQEEIKRYYLRSLDFLDKIMLDDKNKVELKSLANRLIKRDF